MRLHFAKNDPTISAGQGEYDIKIEGNVEPTHFDIYNEAGGRDIGIAKGFSVTVNSNGILDLEFVGANSLISGIEILIGWWSSTKKACER